MNEAHMMNLELSREPELIPLFLREVGQLLHDAFNVTLATGLLTEFFFYDHQEHQ